MHAVRVEGLTKDYKVGHLIRRRRRALDQLTLAIEEGEVFGLIGPNGAGKTTTLKLLFGHIFPTAGHGHILGKPLGDVGVRAEVGYLPENPYFYDYLTGREFLDYMGQLGGLRGPERRARVEELLERVGLTAEAGLELRKYSKGMRQRIGIAQALVNRPRLVFFDEPMSGLDPMGRRQMTLLIQELHRQGVTVFFSSHILPDVEALCDRVAVLSQGRLVREGRVSELQELSVESVELVVEHFTDALLRELQPLARRVSRSGARMRLELADAASVDHALDLVRSKGGRLVSLNPVKQTLEDYFVREVGASGTVGDQA